MDETVRVQVDGATWEVGGADRKRGIWPEDLTAIWDDWGPKTANFILRRSPSVPAIDVGGLTPVEIEKASGIWEGFVDQAPAVDDYSIQVEAIGWPDYGDDDVERKAYVHSGLTDWRDVRSYLNADLAKFTAAPSVEVGDGGIILGYPHGSQVLQNSSWVGAVLDLGPGQVAKRVVVEFENKGFAGAGLYGLAVRASNSIANLDVTYNSNGGDPVSVASPIVLDAFGSDYRYVAIMIVRLGVSGAESADRLIRVKAARVFTDTAYEAGNVSILKASDVLKSSLPRLCPQWSQDLSGIDPTLFSLVEFAPTQPRNFREQGEALNSLHGYIRKLERGRRFRFKPRPVVPLLAAGKWPGLSYRDVSKNATRDIYNKAIGVGTGSDGEPIDVERWASQQPNAMGEAISSPAFPNPTFAVDGSSWTGGTRSTTVFDTSPASYHLDLLSGRTTLSGTFKKGIPYRISGRLRPDVADQATADAMRAAMIITTPTGDGAFTGHVAGLIFNQFNLLQMIWIPRQDATNPDFGIDYFIAATKAPWQAWVDSFTVELVQPTILDRRNRIRTKVLSTSQAMDATTLSALADVFLQTHMRTRARGELTAIGHSLADYSDGRKLDPFEVGEYTGELVSLLDEVDPDTGDIGRNIPIAQVTYTGNDESAGVSLDDANEDFEKLVARYNLLRSGGDL